MLARGQTILIMLLSAILLVPACVVAAQDGEATPESAEIPRFTIRSTDDQPNAWIAVTLEPGDTANLTAVLRNHGKAETILLSYVTNARSAVNGGFTAGAVDEELREPALWLDYPHETYLLPADGEQEVRFTVHVPDDIIPGHYVAALVVQTPEPIDIPGSNVFDQVIRSAMSVEITVSGEATAGMELGKPEARQGRNMWLVEVPITNTGTARLRPHGPLVVTTADGELISTSLVEMGSVYGGNATLIRVALPLQVPVGDYLVSVDLVDEATGATASFVDAPVELAEVEERPVFDVEQASVVPSGEPVQYADVAATIVNNGDAIPTANVTLNVQRNGEVVESYPLGRNQALPQGSTEFAQRYVPVDGWLEGTYTFQLVISAVSGSTETILATVDIEDEIVVPAP